MNTRNHRLARKDTPPPSVGRFPRQYVSLDISQVCGNQRPVTGILYFAFLRSVLRLLVTANVVPISPILVALMMMMMMALSSSGASVLTRARRRNITEDGILCKD
jgi:hypothetical protein